MNGLQGESVTLPIFSFSLLTVLNEAEKSLPNISFLFVQNGETVLHTAFGKHGCLLQTFSYFDSLISSLDCITRVLIFSCVSYTVIRVLWYGLHPEGFAIWASGVVLCEIFLILLLIRRSLCSSLRSNGKPNSFQTIVIDTYISSVYVS